MIQLFRPKYEVEECIKGIREVLESGWTGTGPKCAQFENEFCKFTGAKHAVYLNSATAALHVAVRLLDLPEGSKIATTPITFVSTNHAILYEGHVPVFVDIDEDQMCMDPYALDKVLKEHDIKAVIWVHYAGQVHPEFRNTVKILNGKGIHVIEDCAHAMGAFYYDKYEPKRVGALNTTISCFSFQSVKNLPTMDSGMLVVPNAEMLERARRLSWLGIDKSTYSRTGSQTGSELYKWRYSCNEVGWKYNGNDIAAAIALVQLKVLDRDNAYRHTIHQWYNELFATSDQAWDRVMLLRNSCGSCHLYAIMVQNRDEVMAELKLKGYAPGVHYLPNYEFDVYAQYYTKGQCPSAEICSTQLLSLPCHLELTRADVEAIVAVVTDAAKPLDGAAQW